MALRLQDKKALVAEVSDVAQRAFSAVTAEYRGLTAGDMDALRKEARDNGVYLHVVKNTLAKRAVEGTDFECLNPALTGPIILGFSMEDPGAVGRVLKAFAKDHDKFVVTGVAVGGKLMDGSAIGQLADLPTYDQAIAMLMGTMQAPIAKFVRTLAEPTAKMVRTVQAVADKKAA